jgi:hypothetical protein
VPPFEITQTVNNSLSSAKVPAFTWGNPFNGQPLASANPNHGQPCPGTNLALLSCVAPNVFAAPGSLKHTYMQQWNLALQTQILKNLSVEVAYVGNRTTHAQLISVPDNVPAPGAGAIQGRRPYPQWGQFSMGETNGIGFYNALQAKVEKRFSSGFQMLASYTYSRCMDSGSNQNAPPAVCWLHQNYGPCDYDMPQNLTTSSVYELPFGKGRHFMSYANRLVDGVLGGWEVAGVRTWLGQSGPRSQKSDLPLEEHRDDDQRPQHAQRTFPRRHDQVILVLGRSGGNRRRHMQYIVAAGNGFPPPGLAFKIGTKKGQAVSRFRRARWCVNYRVGSFLRGPKEIGSTHWVVNTDQPAES